MKNDWLNPVLEDIHESTESHGGAGSETNPLVRLDPGLFIWTIITFGIFLLLIAKFGWKPLMNSIESRENEIKNSLHKANLAKEELDKLNLTIEESMEKSKIEAQSILTQAKSLAKKAEEDILALAKQKAKEELEKAKEEIAVEKNKALGEIRNEIVSVSVAIAEKILLKNLSEKDNIELIDETIKNMKEYEA